MGTVRFQRFAIAAQHALFEVALTSAAADMQVIISFGVAMLLVAIPTFNRAMTK